MQKRFSKWLPLALLMLSSWMTGLVVSGKELVNHDSAPAGFGQLESVPALFQGGVDDQGRTYWLNGQAAQYGKLVLTASNGFFDHGKCRAFGESPLPKIGDDSLIKPNFQFLGKWKEVDGTLRWHLWLAQAGTVRLNINMEVSQSEAGSDLWVSMDGNSQAVTTVPSTCGTPQPWDLAFRVTEPGEHTVSVSAVNIRNKESGVGELHTIDVFGTAIQNSKLLRARWRPAAVQDGNNVVVLNELKPDTTYYYRVLIANEDGKVWSFQTHSFRTQ